MHPWCTWYIQALTSMWVPSDSFYISVKQLAFIFMYNKFATVSLNCWQNILYMSDTVLSFFISASETDKLSNIKTESPVQWWGNFEFCGYLCSKPLLALFPKKISILTWKVFRHLSFHASEFISFAHAALLVSGLWTTLSHKCLAWRE